MASADMIDVKPMVNKIVWEIKSHIIFLVVCGFITGGMLGFLLAQLLMVWP